MKFFLTAFCLLVIFLPASAQALPYENCVSDKQSPVCKIAFLKLKTLINPITKKKFFHNGINIWDDGSLFMFPSLHVATPDLDGDGKPEIIVSVPEKSTEAFGQFCINGDQCPHFIIQDRTLPGERRVLSNFKAIGPIYAYAVALSTDERFDTFLSLRAYYDDTWQNFDAYQYDAKTDQYYNVSVGP